MKEYKTENLRNLGILGHSGVGKTSLAEALMYYTKSVDRLGKVDDGTTIFDYDAEEKKRKISISASIAPTEWKGAKINIVDMPGYFDFVGEVIQGIKAIDLAMIVVDASAGVKVGTEKSWDYVINEGIPRAFFINKLDRENSNFEKSLEGIKEKFGSSVVPIQYPIGSEENFKGIINLINGKAYTINEKTLEMQESEVPSGLIDKVEEYKNLIIEGIAETDEELLEKYFNDGTLNDEDLYLGLVKGIVSGELSPVLCGSSISLVGIECLLDSIVQCFPAPNKIKQVEAKDSNGEIVNINYDEKDLVSLFVFKTIADPFVGKLSIFKVISGKLQGDSVLYNANKEKTEKISSLYLLKGKSQVTVNEIIAGDIGAVSKLQFTSTGDTLCDQSKIVKFSNIEFPKPVISMSVIPKTKNDEDKISLGLSKLLEEDSTFSLNRDVENAENIISGLGETHLEIIASKLKSKFGAEVTLEIPKVPYRETIKKSSDVQGKHKKQSGGHGQYGDVKIKFEPRYDGEDLLFVDEVVGGVVPRQYIPAVEKGLKECIAHGVLAGYPVIKLKATLHDGSFHPVDSSEMAFKIAASLAYKKGLQEAESILLEPIMRVETFVPDEYMGDVIGYINKKRGKVLGMEQVGKLEKIISEVPMSELFRYATELRSMTQARGDFKMTFDRYDEVPQSEALKIIEQTKALKEDA